MTTPALRVATAAFVLMWLSACDSATRPEPVMANAPLAATTTNLTEQGIEDGWEGGAIVLNSGQGKPDAFCFFQGTFFTNDVTLVRTPSGNWTLSCRFEDLAPIAEEETLVDWRCSIIGDPTAPTHQSSWVRSPSGTAHLECQYSDKPIEDAVIQYGEVTAAAQQAAFSLSLREFPGQEISGESVSVGLGCGPISADVTGKIAVAERGVCTFTTKVQNALNAGAAAIIVFNSAAFGDQIIVMGGTAVNLPAVFVGRSTGLALLAASPASVTISFCNRSASCRGAL